MEEPSTSFRSRLTPTGALHSPPSAAHYSDPAALDFAALAHTSPQLASLLKRKTSDHPQLDFSDPVAVRALTSALLARDFALSIDLPDDRLCPPAPNRWNYVCWVAALIESTTDVEEELESGVVGVDVGTGASAIYPLLALRAKEKWRMVASEVDEKNLGYARENVRRNFGDGQGGERCWVVQAEGGEKNEQGRSKDDNYDGNGPWLFPLRQLAHRGVKQVDFVMTNPPFYESVAELVQCAEGKKRKPFSSCTGAEVEMVYSDGGEVGFVGRLMAESVQLHRKDKSVMRVRWWTTMLGKLSSVAVLVEKVRKLGCMNYAVTEFVQGSKTRRWGFAWSWEGWRPTGQVARGITGHGLEKRLWPVAAELEFEVEDGVVATGKLVDEVVEELELDDEEGADTDDGVRWNWKPQTNTGVGVCRRGDCWSRKARRAREMERRRRMAAEDQDMRDMHDEPGGNEDDEPKLVFKISVSKSEQEQEGSSTVQVRWLRGQDAILFESFYGWLKRKLKES